MRTAVVYPPPTRCEGLESTFSRNISRYLVRQLAEREVIELGPHYPNRAARYAFVTTWSSPQASGLETLDDLPDRTELDEA